jgi:hypothetical protein
MLSPCTKYEEEIITSDIGEHFIDIGCRSDGINYFLATAYEHNVLHSFAVIYNDRWLAPSTIWN